MFCSPMTGTKVKALEGKERPWRGALTCQKTNRGNTVPGWLGVTKSKELEVL